MDFTPTEEQIAVAEAASKILADFATGIEEVERSDRRFDAEAWEALRAADLVTLDDPLLVNALLEQQGIHLVMVPLLWNSLAPVEGVLTTCALAGFSAGRPQVVIDSDGRVSGVEALVPYAQVAQRIVVPARNPVGEIVVCAVEAAATSMEPVFTTNRECHPTVDFSGARGDALAIAPDDLLRRARSGLAALALGVSAEAIRRTAIYLGERHQFGRPLSSFQGTLLRAADAAIDVEAIRVTALQAAWRLSEGREAAEAVAIAAYEASFRCQRVVHAAQHLHGGVGADITYPIHRWFLWGKQIELMLGGPSQTLAELGALL